MPSVAQAYPTAWRGGQPGPSIGGLARQLTAAVPALRPLLPFVRVATGPAGMAIAAVGLFFEMRQALEEWADRYGQLSNYSLTGGGWQYCCSALGAVFPTPCSIVPVLRFAAGPGSSCTPTYCIVGTDLPLLTSAPASGAALMYRAGGRQQFDGIASCIGNLKFVAGQAYVRPAPIAAPAAPFHWYPPAIRSLAAPGRPNVQPVPDVWVYPNSTLPRQEAANTIVGPRPPPRPLPWRVIPQVRPLPGTSQTRVSGSDVAKEEDDVIIPGQEVVIQIGANGLARRVHQGRYATAVRAPAPNEIKVRLPYQQRAVFMAMAANSEINDFFSVLWKSMPRHIRSIYDDTPSGRIRAFLENWQSVDVGAFATNLAVDQIEDMAYGQMFGRVSGTAYGQTQERDLFKPWQVRRDFRRWRMRRLAREERSLRRQIRERDRNWRVRNK